MVEGKPDPFYRFLVFVTAVVFIIAICILVGTVMTVVSGGLNNG
jgi:hypothetical protein